MASPSVRSGALPHRPVRSAQLRPQHAARRRTADRSVVEHHRQPHRRHRGVARVHLGVQRWLVFGGSWGSALALAYAERFVHRVSEMVLFGVTTGRREEFDWLFRDGLAPLFPEEWQRRRDAIPPSERSATSSKPIRGCCTIPMRMCERAPRTRGVCGNRRRRIGRRNRVWRRRFSDPRFALAFARIVTHYVRHDAWLGDGGGDARHRSARDSAWRADQRPLRPAGAARHRVGTQPPLAAVPNSSSSTMPDTRQATRA